MWSKATSGVDALMLQNIALIKDKLEYTTLLNSPYLAAIIFPPSGFLYFPWPYFLISTSCWITWVDDARWRGNKISTSFPLVDDM